MEWNRLLSEKRYASDDVNQNLAERNDYDRIICSTLFRRLQDKAQVFPYGRGRLCSNQTDPFFAVPAIGKRLREYVFRGLKESRTSL